ncbi:sulfite exporter TauE/SafE family protein [Sinirhodobacter ferrireducens]|uniref:Probable membrane transporter protein n=1 Tax=Paenirhodobacter ferrireducens TaxID=1215032 RepID=A0A443L4T1_9RHOB|nr:sulfite exporter TauE/SafE family protein [Sinirhodobacter ferrireducens]RWR44212.1 sulfite exporter TauE/SafE family protein [Sinirhodobacter ferrireducens]
MQIYLPIAEVSVNAFLLLGLGGIVGLLSGLFGVGGGFLITPLLFFIGIPPSVAVATGANQVVASSVSGVLAQFKRKAVDVPMGVVLLLGGILGSALGIWVFNRLTKLGQIDLVVQLAYVLFLGSIGLLMLQEAVRAIRRARRPGARAHVKRHQHNWVHKLPLKMKFRASGLYISVIPPALVGMAVGVLAAIMGVGGGFIMVPAMIYLLGMPTKVVIGTSLFQILFVSAFTTLMHAITNQSVDVMLALLLIIGGVIGAQVGSQLGGRLKAEQLRILLALLVIAVAAKLGLDLLIRPAELFSLFAGARG